MSAISKASCKPAGTHVLPLGKIIPEMAEIGRLPMEISRILRQHVYAAHVTKFKSSGWVKYSSPGFIRYMQPG